MLQKYKKKRKPKQSKYFIKKKFSPHIKTNLLILQTIEQSNWLFRIPSKLILNDIKVFEKKKNKDNMKTPFLSTAYPTELHTDTTTTTTTNNYPLQSIKSTQTKMHV